MSRSQRVKGTGTIFYNQARDRWMAQTTITDPATGRTKKVTRSARTAKEAQTLLTQLQAGQRPEDAGLTTVHAWMDWYLTSHTQQRLRTGEITGTTAQSCEVRVKRLKQMIPAKLTLADLDAAQLDQLRARYDQSTYARATQNRDLKQLSTMLDLAVYHGLLSVNKAKVMRRLPTPAKPKPILTAAQAAQLLDDVRGHWMEPWYVIAVPLGARCMEICGLSWNDLDLTNHQVTFRHQLVDRHGALRLAPLKSRGEGEERRAPLAPWQVERLHTIRARQEEAKASRPDWVGNDFNLVVTSPRGKAVYNSHVRKDLQARVARLGLPPITPHSFRRTAASLLLARGVDVATVMKIMGWKSSQVPLEIYAQLTNEGFDQVRNVFDNLRTTT